jgi:hypothetical protein
MGKHLDEIKTEFERGVFLAVYRSRNQRLKRAGAATIILSLHFIRGALIASPLYLVILALAYSPLAEQHPWYLALLLPGAIGWGWVLIKGARSDYRRLIKGRLLEHPLSWCRCTDD